MQDASSRKLKQSRVARMAFAMLPKSKGGNDHHVSCLDSVLNSIVESCYMKTKLHARCKMQHARVQEARCKQTSEQTLQHKKMQTICKSENYRRKLLGLGSTGSSKSEKPEGKPTNPNPWNRQGKRDRQPDGKNRQDKNGRNDKRQKTGDKAVSCKGCGRSPHPDGKCPFLVYGHPDANKSDKTWDKSDSGIAWLKKKQPACPYNFTLLGDPFHMSSKRREMEKKR